MHVHVKENGSAVHGTDTVVRADDGNQYAAIAWEDGVTTFKRDYAGDPVVVVCDPEPADTKSDPEVERIAYAAIAAFWSVVSGNVFGNAITNDTRLRLEIAAYDAVEEWRAENPAELPTAPFDWQPAPQWAKDAKDQDSQQS